jgi:Zinc binding domain
MKDSTFTLGSVVAVFLGSVCCLSPLLLGGLGLGTVLIATFASLGPYFLALSAILLAVGFYFGCRRPTTVFACEVEPCAPRAHGKRTAKILWPATSALTRLTRPRVSPRDHACPRCGARGQTVGRETLAALLTRDALARLQDGPYFFDRSPDCEVVNFSNETDAHFSKRDLRVRVGIKESDPPIPICYCFGHTIRSARSEIQATGRSTVAAQITKEIKAGNCACEVKNPSGRCCLGEVNKAVKELLRESETMEYQ